ALTDIVAGRFDAGIRPGERVARDMIALRVSDELPVVVVAAPAYLARRGEPKTPQELAAHDCIRLRLPSGGFFPWRFRLNRRIVEVHVEGPLIVNGSTIPLTAAIQGAGLEIGRASCRERGEILVCAGDGREDTECAGGGD